MLQQVRSRVEDEKTRHVSWVLITILGALGALNPLSIDASLPALPVMGHALQASDAQMQATLGGFMLAFGAGMIFVGLGRGITLSFTHSWGYT